MEQEQGRISVLRKDQLVPLFAKPGRKAVKSQPWKGLLLEQHEVSATEIPEHEHRELCLHLQIRGDSDFEWWSEGRNRIEKTAPGSLILLPAGTRDRLLWQGNSERIVISIAPYLLQSLGCELGRDESPRFAANWRLQSSSLRPLIAEMGREAAEGWPLGGLYADLLAMSLSKQLLSRYATERLVLPALRGGLTMPRLRRAMEFMRENQSRDLRLDAVAEVLGLSAFHFAHAFRESAGQTPYQYVLDQRMGRAKQLLRETNWSMQEIAEQSGFGSAVNFVRAFRQRIGVTPGIWRLQ
ncbi:helix-turn-helix domain-containing protein [Granulicella paludicola]|uniref:helix-turn-helix domain-containing protein n=1 Tax=Granulicella paludicola TaxID=474951 RepID=UPI0021E0F63A|nr:AraC family transcriptional regulator [Granulicella paludicola]